MWVSGGLDVTTPIIFPHLQHLDVTRYGDVNSTLSYVLHTFTLPSLRALSLKDVSLHRDYQFPTDDFMMFQARSLFCLVSLSIGTINLKK